MRRVLGISLVLMLASSFSGAAEVRDSTTLASEPIFKFTMGAKHINVARLGLSPHTTVFEALQLLPEMMSHGYTDNLSSYSVAIDGYSLGVAKDEALYQMTIAELKEIVVSDDPTLSYDSGGVGGSINLVTKDIADGVSGNGQLDVSTETDILVSTTVNYKRPKLSIRGYLKAEYMNLPDSYSRRTFNEGTLVESSDITKNQRGGGEQVKLALYYNPTDKDALKVAFWQRYANSVETTVNGNYSEAALGSGVATFTRLNYSHQFNERHGLALNANYSYTRENHSDKDKHNLAWNRPHNANATIGYSGVFYKSDSHTVLMNLGATLDFSNTRYGPVSPFRETDLSLIPNAEFDWLYKDIFSLRMSGSYNFEHWHSTATGQHLDCQDYMIRMELLYSPAPGNTLRLVGLRNQLPTERGQRTGYVVSTNLAYVFEKQVGEHLVNLSAAMQYDHTELFPSTTYNVLSPQLSLFWQVRWFSLGFASTVYTYFSKSGSMTPNVPEYKGPRNLYYVFRLTPVFRLPKDWCINATLMYDSGVSDQFSVTDDYFYTALRVGKKVKNWLIHAELGDPFHYKTTDFILNGTYRFETVHYPYKRYLNIGVTCNF